MSDNFSSFNHFKEMCSDTMNDTIRQFDMDILETAIKMRLFPPKFVPSTDDEGQYVSEPFGDFYGECDDCQYFRCNDGGLSGGVGWCQFHKVAGYGYTCEHHKFQTETLYEIQQLEDEIAKGNGEPLDR